jgi:hypothetical protein
LAEPYYLHPNASRAAALGDFCQFSVFSRRQGERPAHNSHVAPMLFSGPLKGGTGFGANQRVEAPLSLGDMRHIETELIDHFVNHFSDFLFGADAEFPLHRITGEALEFQNRPAAPNPQELVAEFRYGSNKTVSRRAREDLPSLEGGFRDLKSRTPVREAMSRDFPKIHPPVAPESSHSSMKTRESQTLRTPSSTIV